MKKILHISKYYFPFKGGTEQIAQDCVNSLARYKQKIICFNNGTGNVKDKVDGIEVVRCGCFTEISSQPLSLSYGRILKNIIGSFKPDIVVFHYPNPFVAYYLLKYLPGDTKFVLYWHLDIIKQKFLRKFFNLQNRKLLKRADKIIVTSYNYIKGSPWLKQVENKCVVIPNCINVQRLEKTVRSKSIEKKIKKKNNGKIICLAVGRHTEYQGFTYLIQASRYLDDRFRIYITGKGELTEKLKHEASGDNKIQFLGSVPDDVLKAYLSAMDIFCFPSVTKNEAFGLALAEGMYYSKPAVTFTIEGSGVNFVNLNGITGIEVPNRDAKAYADAIKKLASNRELREQYGRNGRKRVVENFLDKQFRENTRREIGSL